MKVRAWCSQVFLRYPITEVFEYFSNARNLEEITPRFLQFRVITPQPIELRKGTTIEYRLKIRGIPVRWISEITVWQPPFRFVDEQRKGPYRLWIHEHTFEARSGGTLVADRVWYRSPGGLLEPLIDRFFVRPDVRRIFSFRKRKLTREIFPDAAAAAASL